MSLFLGVSCAHYLRYDRDALRYHSPENRRIVNILLSTAACAQRLFRIFSSVLWQLLLFFLSLTLSLSISLYHTLSPFLTIRKRFKRSSYNTYLAFERKIVFVRLHWKYRHDVKTTIGFSYIYTLNTLYTPLVRSTTLLLFFGHLVNCHISIVRMKCKTNYWNEHFLFGCRIHWF